MAQVIVHTDGSGNVRLEYIAPGRPIQSGPNIIDSSAVPPGKQDWMDWNGTVLTINQAKKNAYNAIDRRTPFDKLVDLMEADGILTKQKADLLRGP